MLECLPIEQDEIRIEDEVTAEFLGKWLVNDYTALGYSIVRVPLLSPNDRLEFVLEKIDEKS